MKNILILFVFSTLLIAVKANNISVTNVSLTRNATTHTGQITFTIAWENSWRTSTNESNYDGAWIFIKYRKTSTSDWRHATISVTGFVAGTGATLKIPPDGKGSFIYRSANGIGNVSYVANKLTWNTVSDGVLDNETVEIKVFAVEMVYIPTGNFYLGSGGSEAVAFTDGNSKNPFLVTTNPITFGLVPGTLNPHGYGPLNTTLPAAFPTGYNAFWIMKYECTWRQYLDFLNNINLAMATINNTIPFNVFPLENGPDAILYYVKGVHPNFSSDAILYPVFLYAADQRSAAFADWSGLRPMSEMEFEKACRGANVVPVPNEYAWGNTFSSTITNVANFRYTNESVASPSDANNDINNVNYLLDPFGNSFHVSYKVGIFARASGSSRTLSGGTYYGVMNMSDHVKEVCVTIVNPEGRAFNSAIHGDGYLAANGNSDIPTWTNKNVFGMKGSWYGGNLDDARVSDRRYVNWFSANQGVVINSNGFRLARTAP